MEAPQRAQLYGAIEQLIDSGMELDAVRSAVLRMRRLSPGERLELAEWAWAWHETKFDEGEDAVILQFPPRRARGHKIASQMT